MGGGDADVEEAIVRRPAVPGVLHRDAVGTYHKSALAVRQAPERLA